MIVKCPSEKLIHGLAVLLAPTSEVGITLFQRCHRPWPIVESIHQSLSENPGHAKKYKDTVVCLSACVSSRALDRLGKI